MPQKGYEQIPEGGLTIKTVNYGSLHPSDVEVDAPIMSAPTRGRSRAIVLGFAALLFAGVAIIGYASAQNARRSTEAVNTPSPLRSTNLPTMDLVADTTTGDDTSDKPPTVSPNVTKHEWKGCRNCTVTECSAAMCDASAAPFACVSGFAKGGCSKVSTSWDNPGCQDCCDMSVCNSLAKPCGKCTDDDCFRLGPVCGLKRPYVCAEGPSNNGCSDEKGYWPSLSFSGVCTRCCDLNTCAEKPGCDPCTETECIQVGRGCFNSSTPFACAQGAAMGGCASTEEYWKKAEFSGICLKCCDTSPCNFTSTSFP